MITSLPKNFAKFCPGEKFARITAGVKLLIYFPAKCNFMEMVQSIAYVVKGVLFFLHTIKKSFSADNPCASFREHFYSTGYVCNALYKLGL